VATLLQELTSVLKNDSVLTNPPLGFLVFDYWITPGRPAVAFDPANGNRLKRSIVILHGGEVEHPQGSTYDFSLWDSFPEFYIYAEAHQNGKTAATQAKIRIEQLLGHRYISCFEGNNITLKRDNEIRLEDSDLFPGNVVSIVRWRATGARALVGV
jgi:hypothetical protein